MQQVSSWRRFEWRGANRILEVIVRVVGSHVSGQCVMLCFRFMCILPHVILVSLKNCPFIHSQGTHFKSSVYSIGHLNTSTRGALPTKVNTILCERFRLVMFVKFHVCQACQLWGPWCRRDDDGTYVVLFQSTEHPSHPQPPRPWWNWWAPIRGNVRPSPKSCPTIRYKVQGHASGVVRMSRPVFPYNIAWHMACRRPSFQRQTGFEPPVLEQIRLRRHARAQVKQDMGCPTGLSDRVV
jgi:hypothetical protein